MSNTLESGWDREELAVAEQMLLGQAHVIQQVFPSITNEEMAQVFAGCAEWHSAEPVETPDLAGCFDEVPMRIVGHR